MSFLTLEGINVLEVCLSDLQRFTAGLHDIGIHPRSQARIRLTAVDGRDNPIDFFHRQHLREFEAYFGPFQQFAGISLQINSRAT